MPLTIDQIIAAANKQFGPGTILRASEATSLVVDRFGSGVFDLDIRLGGGIPRGRIITYKGGFSSGKSTVAMLNVAQAQSSCRYCGALFERVNLLGEYEEFPCICGKREPMLCFWLDAEHSFDPSWAQRWGIDTDKLYLLQTEYAEQAIDLTAQCIHSRQCDLVVIDSVAALTPGVEVEQSSQDMQMGVFARLMNKALRRWTAGMNSMGLLSETKCSIILINQERVGIGGFKPTITAPGGKGIDFFESIEVRFKKHADIEDKAAARPIGIEVEFSIRKNKTYPMASPGMFSLYFVDDPGNYRVGQTDIDAQVLRLAIYWGLVKKGGAWLTFPDGSRYQGVAKGAQALRDNPDLLEAMKIKVREKELSWTKEGSLALNVSEDQKD